MQKGCSESNLPQVRRGYSNSELDDAPPVSAKGRSSGADLSQRVSRILFPGPNQAFTFGVLDHRFNGGESWVRTSPPCDGFAQQDRSAANEIVPVLNPCTKLGSSLDSKPYFVVGMCKFGFWKLSVDEPRE